MSCWTLPTHYCLDITILTALLRLQEVCCIILPIPCVNLSHQSAVGLYVSIANINDVSFLLISTMLLRTIDMFFFLEFVEMLICSDLAIARM